MEKHEWLCDECGNSILFQQPELPQDDFNSEQNEERKCECGATMFFSEVEE